MQVRHKCDVAPPKTENSIQAGRVDEATKAKRPEQRERT